MIHFFGGRNNINYENYSMRAEGVTGSCFLVITGNTKILIDCGFFQGSEEERNLSGFDFNPRKINYLILTHAHLDHSGRIPLLVKSGFNGKIICTRGTYEITKIMLLDSAKVMYEDFASRKRKAQRRGESVRPPLYSEEDVLSSYSLFFPVAYDQQYKISDTLGIVLRDAGHILGSSFVELNSTESAKVKRIVFSGDLGNENKPIVKDPLPPSDSDVVFVESTYGDRNHKDFSQSCQEFEEAVEYAFSRNGNVIIPSFALERSQEILYMLREMYYQKKLPSCRVFLDSPLAIAATNIFRSNSEYFDEEAQKITRSGEDPFYFPYLIYSKTVEDSKSINNIRERAIIIAGSGMCNGGRILHHLKHNLWNENNCIVFVGYQSQGTTGRKIIDGEKTVHIYGEKVNVNAKIFTINGFSSHADKSIIKKWLSYMPSLDKIYLIHGEKNVMEKFKSELSLEFKANVSVARHLQEIIL
jgi:metallo-beta-lactamase family protein